MSDVIDQLHSYADAVTPTVGATPNPRLVNPAPVQRPVRRPLRVAVIAAVIVVMAGLVVAGVDAVRSDPTPRAHGPTSTSATPRGTVPMPVDSSGVEIMERPPLSPRGDVAAAWTGRELMIWGGDLEAFNMGLSGPDRSFTDGATYDPTTRTWQAMASGPLPATATTPVAVATPRGVVIARDAKVAIWNPETNSWRALADAPEPVSDLTDIGTAVISVSARSSLDLGSGTWQPLPNAPRTVLMAPPIWTGAELIVFGLRSSESAAAAYDPRSRIWRAIPLPQGLNLNALSAAWDGQRVVATDGARAAAYLTADNAWKPLPPLPTRYSENGSSIAAVAPGAVTAGPGAVGILDRADHWTPLPYPIAVQQFVPLRTSQSSVAPSQVFMIGTQYPSGLLAAALVDPTHWLAAPPAVQVGLVSVALPTDARFVDAAVLDANGSRLRVRLSTPTGACVITSSYGSSVTPQGWTQVDTAGRDWVTHPTTSDVVALSCEDPVIAQSIVRDSPVSPVG